MDSCKVCPICTLYLRPGITLKSHLSTHPKQKVIEALVKFSSKDEVVDNPPQITDNDCSSVVTTVNPQMMVSAPPFQENHIFVYQRMMSSSSSSTSATPAPSGSSAVSGNQQYIIPTILNPYMYQQQQLLLSNSPCLPQFRISTPLEVILPNDESKTQIQEVVESNNETDNTITIIDENVDNSIDCGPSKACQTSSNSNSNDFKKIYCFQNENAVNFNCGEVITVEATTPTPSDSNNAVYNNVTTLSNFEYNNENSHIIIEETDFQADENNDNVVEDEQFESTIEISKDEISDSEDIDNDNDNDISRGSTSHTAQHVVSIQSDEKMPPRGELSGQESLGSTSEVNWNRLPYEGSSSMLYAVERDNWDDSLDTDEPATAVPPDPLESNEVYKCNLCDETFITLSDQTAHNLEKHDKSKLNLIGTEIGRKTIKKIIVKTKKISTRSSTNATNSSTSTSNGLSFSNTIKAEKENDNNEAGVSKIETVEHEIVENEIEEKFECTLCHLEFYDHKSLQQHNLRTHKNSMNTKFKCSACDETFPNDYKYTEHLKIHPLECYLCGRLFYRRQNIELHMKRHMGVRPYKCEYCPKAFLTKQKMIEHKNTHTGDAPIKCTDCSKRFKRYSNLVQHRNRHHLQKRRKMKDFLCFCGEHFYSRKKLAWHKETHDVKPKSCTQCSEKFVHAASLTRHVRKAHDERYLPQTNRAKVENVECPVCKGVFIKSSLEAHMKIHEGKRPFTCTICNKEFTTKWNLKLHHWTHASRMTKPFKCDQCNSAFVRECDYKSHMNSHKNIKPYTCNHCGARFIRKSNCQRHVREHETEKTFKCSVCAKSFHRSDYLKDHMRVHTGDRPYTCHVCGKTSTTKSNHNKHIYIHHARETITTEN